MQFQAFESPHVQHNSCPASPRKTMHSVDTRLNALDPHFSWFYGRVLLLIGVTWAIQAAELVLLIFTRTLIFNDFTMGERVLEVCNASIFMGAMVGGPIFGHVADCFGRRIALIIAMVCSLGGLAVSARANAGNILIVGRIITGLGFGGQLTSTVVLIQELSPHSMCGRMISLLDAFTGIGGLFGVLLAFAVAPWLEWRTTYFVVCGLVLYAPVVWFAVPESPRWLASVGRTEEAFSVVEKIERLHGLQPFSDDIQKEQLAFTSALESPSSVAESSRAKRLVPTLVLWVLWIAMTLSSYGLGIYVPTLISFSGYNMFASWSTVCVLNIAQVAGSLAAAVVVDTYGPHRCFAVFAAFTAGFSIVLSYVTWSRAVVIVITFLVTALLSSCWSCVFAYTSENYSTTHRSRGVGYAVGVSRLAGVGASYLYPHMYNVWILSVPVMCWIFGGVLTVVGVGVVPRFGYQPVSQNDDIQSNTWTSTGDIEPGANSSAVED
ncbi:Major Facilitator Superfamily (MFS) transporter [Phytophthora megakarya]|uniref:Major Facilitator Superfamily (MFS) transporter n=1 Tax=Phytophthora megakarya TaxID=4795 RepID=A0A225WYR0_9STRA|nr:Major Facilitator Superfamily (MFS) transporter [Phytophthora megakarya]